MVHSVFPSSSISTNCRVIRHEMGETKICGQPRRIVALSPAILELLLALDVQPIGFADHAVFHLGDYTNPGQQIPYLGRQITQPIANVGTAFNPSLEAMLKLQPDLILVMGIYGTAYYKIFSRTAPTLVLNHVNVEGSLRAIAQAVNRSEQAEQLLMETEQQIVEVQKTFAPLVATHPQVLLLASSELPELRLESSAGACSSRLKKLGFQQVLPTEMQNVNPRASVPISLETLPQLNNADLIILLGTNFTEFQQSGSSDSFEDHQLSNLKQTWKKNAIAQALDASKNGRVYFIPAYLCRGLPGPIGTELYLNELKKQLLSPLHH